MLNVIRLAVAFIVACILTRAVAAPIGPGAETNAPALHTRIFKVDQEAFTLAIAQLDPAITNFPRPIEHVQQAVRSLLGKSGVDLQPPKALFFNDRNGALSVHATLADLELVERAIQMMNAAVPRVSIQTRFVEMTLADRSSFGFDRYLHGDPVTWKMRGISPVFSGTNLIAITQILPSSLSKVVLRALEHREGVAVFTTPDATTVSGRQAQIQLVDVNTLLKIAVTNAQPAPMSFGPTLDIISLVVADGYSVHLAVTFSIKEFLGHDKPDAALEQAAHGKGVNAQSPLPRYRVQDLTTTATVPDGQTLVIHGGLKGESGVRQPGGTEARKPDKAPRKDFLVFITPTIIDQAGNRVHTDEEVSQRTNAGLTNQPAFPDTPR